MFVMYGGRFPSEKAAALFAAKSCEVFAAEGVDVTLLVPRRIGRLVADPFTHYGIRKNFSVIFLPIMDGYRWGIPDAVNFFLISLSFALSSWRYLLRCAVKTDIVYSNEILPLWLCSFSFCNTFYEMHDFPESKLFLFARFCRSMRWILIHNKWKAKKFQELFPESAPKVLYQPNAVDIGLFDITATKEEARRLLHLEHKRYMVIYTGSLFVWKGVDTLAEAANYLPDGFLVVFIGGSGDDIMRFRQAYGSNPKIRIEGYRSHQEMPLWQKAGDVLVLPNTAKEDISKYYTSPMKLFEYMASKRPIVASRIPSITEIVDDASAILVVPDDPLELAAGIQKAMEHPEIAEALVPAAFVKVQQYTWENRARAILGFMERPR